MSQPVDRAYVEILPDFDDFEASAKRQITNELRSVGREAEKAGDHVEDSFRDSGREAEKSFRGIGRAAEKAFDDIEDGAKRSEEAIVDVNGRLRDSRGRFLAMGKQAGDSLDDVGGSARTLGQAIDFYYLWHFSRPHHLRKT